MKPSNIILLLAFALVPATALLTAGKVSPARSQERVDRGRYLVTISGCNDCHTPMKPGPGGLQPDASRLLSGHPEQMQLPPPPAGEGPWFIRAAGASAWAGPWGVSFASNLTPDTATGLGIWTEEMFLQAMRHGKHFGTGRDILPPMPWQNFAAATDDDLKAIYAYLRSIPPVHNRVPEAVLTGAPASYE